MANGSIESKEEDSLWPADDSAQSLPSSRNRQDSGTLGDPSDNFSQVGRHLPPLLHPRPPSPVSVAELQERAVQDSQNNNVDENSNDHHFDQYAAAAVASTYPRREASSYPAYPNQEASHYSSSYRDASSYPPYNSRETSHPSRESSSSLSWEASSHDAWRASHPSSSSRDPSSLHSYREAPHQEAQSHHHSRSSHSTQYTLHSSYPSHSVHEAVSASDQSVRPRVRQPSQHQRDEADHAIPPRLRLAPRRDSFSSSSCQHSGLTHRRNRSEGTSPVNRYPPLPNHNCPPKESDGRLPQLPGCRTGNQNPNSPMRWLPLALRGGRCSPQPPQDLPPAENVTQEAQELLTTFTLETLRNNRLDVPQCMQAMPSSSSPHMMRAGRELRLLADAFAGTAERRKVRLMAESVNLSCIEMSDFFQLCAELFYDGITRERIVALFTFVGDVAVHQVRMKGEELIHLLMKWSFRYLVEHVCRWVQEAGGWVAVLTCGANFIYRCAVFAFCVCGSVAASLFIYKTLKNG